MFKPCPNCGFLVALIAGREASQRCPRCGSAMQVEGVAPPAADVPVQDAERRAADHDADANAMQPPTPMPAAAAQVPLPRGTGAQAQATPATRASAAQPDAATDTTDAQVAEPTPSFVAGRPRAAPPRGRRWPWALALPLLALLLALQLLLSQRVELAQDARWRPLLIATCGALGCDVPAWREPGAYVMLARNVRPHPGRPGVLHVTASLRNGARWPQPLPVLVLSLSDIDGRVLAARAVSPPDYGSRSDALVEPGDSIDFAFDVREPSPRVVSFDFQLR